MVTKSRQLDASAIASYLNPLPLPWPKQRDRILGWLSTRFAPLLPDSPPPTI
ncbi:hypothetical protein LKK83_17020 [Phormidium sp. CCY1219]|nr:hypothetical protein [Phormidium sp. CCY1219]